MRRSALSGHLPSAAGEGGRTEPVRRFAVSVATCGESAFPACGVGRAWVACHAVTNRVQDGVSALWCGVQESDLLRGCALPAPTGRRIYRAARRPD